MEHHVRSGSGTVLAVLWMGAALGWRGVRGVEWLGISTWRTWWRESCTVEVMGIRNGGWRVRRILINRGGLRLLG